MISKRILTVGALLVAAMAACGREAPRTDTPEAWLVTDEGHFRVRWSSDLDPVTINEVHTWTVRIEDRDGQPVDGARVVVDGDMPEHRHGLPTVPQMTGQTGRGEYRIEGMKFSMPGLWEVEIAIWSKGVTDRVIVPLTLE